jgi:hypothetical protein
MASLLYLRKASITGGCRLSHWLLGVNLEIVLLTVIWVVQAVVKMALSITPEDETPNFQESPLTAQGIPPGVDRLFGDYHIYIRDTDNSF